MNSNPIIVQISTKWAIIVCFMCGFTNVKIGPIQLVNFIIILAIANIFIINNHSFSIIHRSIRNFKFHIFNLLLLIFILSILSLRLNLYPPGDFGLLKSPPWASLFRFLEICITLLVIPLILISTSRSSYNFRLIFRAYTSGGLLSCLIAIFSYIGTLFGLELPGVTVGSTIRMCGLFVEGGPFGVYLVSILLFYYVRYFHLKSIDKYSFYLQVSIVIIALIGSQSKSAILLSIIILIIQFVKRNSKLSALYILAPLSIFIISSNFSHGIKGYYENLVRFEIAAQERPDDSSLVMGRLMAAKLLPRIISEHPILGIGIGNYSLIRNDPSILRGLPPTKNWDLHGLGILGYVAELGIPLTVYAIFIYLYPFLNCRKTKKWISLLSVFPTLSVIFGAQLNFSYPWVVLSLALAAINLQRNFTDQRSGLSKRQSMKI